MIYTIEYFNNYNVPLMFWLRDWVLLRCSFIWKVLRHSLSSYVGVDVGSVRRGRTHWPRGTVASICFYPVCVTPGAAAANTRSPGAYFGPDVAGKWAVPRHIIFDRRLQRRRPKILPRVDLIKRRFVSIQYLITI